MTAPARATGRPVVCRARSSAGSLDTGHARPYPDGLANRLAESGTFGLRHEYEQGGSLGGYNGVPSEDERAVGGARKLTEDIGAQMRELTDSYCERCGTRYTFGPSPTRGPSLTGARLLAKGLKNFVMTDGTSMDEAMAAARIDVTKDESSRVTEEFHRTFNFCITCRQYACDKCWNENQSACLSCAPLWDREPVAPQNHLIIRTPVSRQDSGDTVPAPSQAELAPGRAGAPDEVPWPDADPLPGRTPPSPGGNGHRPPETAPAVPAAQAWPLPQLRTRAPSSRPRRSRLSRQSSRPTAAGPEPRPAPQQPRQPARVSEEERSAAQELRAQSQAWKSRDDGLDPLAAER